MSFKTTLYTAITTLILVFAVVLTFSLNDSVANDETEICGTPYPDQDPVCQGAKTNCLCPIIVTPEEN